MSLENVEKLIKDNKVEFIDLRFTDVRGVQHHVTFPKSIVDASLFEDGKMFDGSSISGWKGINESDMVLLPDASTAIIDPFTADPTLILTCDILDPATMQAYSRDPRGIAKRAEAYLKSTGIGDTAYFGPEPEFFVFDSIRWDSSPSGSFVHIDEYEAPWNSGRDFADGSPWPRERQPGPVVDAGFFPVTLVLPEAPQWLLVAAINSDYFINPALHDQVSAPLHHSIYADDGTLLFSCAEDEQPGTVLAPQGRLEHILERQIGTAQWAQADGQEPQLAAFRTSRSHPWFVLSQTPRQEVLRPWERQTRSLTLIAALTQVRRKGCRGGGLCSRLCPRAPPPCSCRRSLPPTST